MTKKWTEHFISTLDFINKPFCIKNRTIIAFNQDPFSKIIKWKIRVSGSPNKITKCEINMRLAILMILKQSARSRITAIRPLAKSAPMSFLRLLGFKYFLSFRVEKKKFSRLLRNVMPIWRLNNDVGNFICCRYLSNYWRSEVFKMPFFQVASCLYLL